MSKSELETVINAFLQNKSPFEALFNKKRSTLQLAIENVSKEDFEDFVRNLSFL